MERSLTLCAIAISAHSLLNNLTNYFNPYFSGSIIDTWPIWEGADGGWGNGGREMAGGGKGNFTQPWSQQRKTSSTLSAVTNRMVVPRSNLDK